MQNSYVLWATRKEVTVRELSLVLREITLLTKKACDGASILSYDKTVKAIQHLKKSQTATHL
jgi:hypothetical protein